MYDTGIEVFFKIYLFVRLKEKEKKKNEKGWGGGGLHILHLLQ